MLKRLLGLSIGIAALSACAVAPPPQDIAADTAKLKADAAVWFDHMSKGDADAAANLYAEDAVVQPDKAVSLTGRAAIRGYLAATIAELKTAGLSFKDGGPTGAGVSGDMGWISGTFSVTDAAGATVDRGKYLSVHHRTNGAWLYIRDTWNSDAAPAPPPPPAAVKK